MLTMPDNGLFMVEMIDSLELTETRQNRPSEDEILALRWWASIVVDEDGRNVRYNGYGATPKEALASLSYHIKDSFESK